MSDHWLMRLQTVSLYIIILAGFALRLRYLLSSHPFYDEYSTVLAARQILQQGWPLLPSGLFYEHGLLATYLIAPFTALFITMPPAEWQPAHWGLMLARWPSLLLGTATIPLIFALGRRWLPGRMGAAAAVLAAGLFAFSPEGMVWGGRARMYALATLLFLLAAAWAYRGAVDPAPARYRWRALLALLALLLTQFGGMILVPPLIAGMGIVGWLSSKIPGQGSRRPWFLRPTIFGEGIGLAAVIGLAVLVKRLGRPLGATNLAEVESSSLPAELLDTISYQAAFHFTWADTVTFLARQFGPPHHAWLTGAALLGAVAGLLIWRGYRRPARLPVSLGALFLAIVFGLVIVEMVTLLAPFRRNPRYVLMVLPLFYLVAARAVLNLPALLALAIGSWRPAARRLAYNRPAVLALLFLIFFGLVGWPDVRIALATPEPAYEVAFAYVRQNWQPGDVLLTMNTPAAGLYLDRADGFTVQTQAEQFLLEREAAPPVDRWWGAPWVGTAAEFNAILNAHERAWFVIDTIRLPTYFRGDWQAVVSSQMEQAWAGDNALVFRSRPGRQPLPTQPDLLVQAILDHTIQLVGYSLQQVRDNGRRDLRLTLFWQPLAVVETDYTVFVHLRDSDGHTVAQYDSQPLAGAYPTGQWQPGETITDPITLALPADLPRGTYTLWAGLYNLETLARLPVVNDTSGENAVLVGEVTLP